MTLETTVVGCPAIDGVKVLPGSKLYTCFRCGQATWVSPSGQKLVNKGARVMCLICMGEINPPPSQIMPVTDEQLAEVRKVLGNDVTKEELNQLIHNFLKGEQYGQED